MNNAVFVARRDHEVYFAPIDDCECRSRKKRYARAEEVLRERHPGFSEASSFDVRTFRVTNARWMMITVMELVDIRDYRALHPFRPLVTVTSSLVAKGGFEAMPVTRFGDEIVGFSAERGEPVSEPIACSAVTDGCMAADRDTERDAAMLRVRNLRRAEVFANPFLWAVRLVAVVGLFALIVSAPAVFFSFANPRPTSISVSDPVDPYDMIEAGRLRSMENSESPDALSALRDIARAILSARGAFDVISCGMTPIDTVRIDAHGCDPGALKAAFGEIEYLQPGTVGRVEYRDGISFFPLSARVFDSVQDESRAESPIADTAFFSFVERVRSHCPSGGAFARSAEIDSSGEGKVSLFVADESLPAVLLGLSEESRLSGLRVMRVSVTVDREKRSFGVSCSVMAVSRGNSATTRYSTSTNAFYEVLDAAGLGHGADRSERIALLVEDDAEFNAEALSRVGSIDGIDGSRSSYFRSDDGKIFETEE